LDQARQRPRWWIVAAIGAGFVTIAVVVLWRGFTWMMALFSGGGVGVLVFMTLQTAERIWRQWQGPER
jgi:hypothetical protein